MPGPVAWSAPSSPCLWALEWEAPTACPPDAVRGELDHYCGPAPSASTGIRGANTVLPGYGTHFGHAGCGHRGSKVTRDKAQPTPPISASAASVAAIGVLPPWVRAAQLPPWLLN